MSDNTAANTAANASTSASTAAAVSAATTSSSSTNGSSDKRTSPDPSAASTAATTSDSSSSRDRDGERRSSSSSSSKDRSSSSSSSSRTREGESDRDRERRSKRVSIAEEPEILNPQQRFVTLDDLKDLLTEQQKLLQQYLKSPTESGSSSTSSAETAPKTQPPPPPPPQQQQQQQQQHAPTQQQQYYYPPSTSPYVFGIPPPPPPPPPPPHPLSSDALTETSSCELCRSYLATIYLIDGDLLLCNNCSRMDRFGVERVPASEMPLHRRFCLRHPNGVIKFFCETCGIGVCGYCRMTNHHQAVGHHVVALRDAFLPRLESLQQRVGSLFPHHNTALLHAHSLHRCISEVEAARNILEADARRKLDDYIRELNARVHEKCNPYRVQLKGIAAELDRVEEVLQRIGVRGTPRSAADMLTFLTHYHTLALQTAAESHSADFQIDVPHVSVDDLPVFQVDDGRLAAAERLIAMKDEMIWMMVKEREDAKRDSSASPRRPPHLTNSSSSNNNNNNNNNNNVRASLDHSFMLEDMQLDPVAQAEIAKWLTLSDKYAEELGKFQMKCAFCAQKMGPSSVNGNCSANGRDNVGIDFGRAYNDVALGSGRHCWVAI